MNEIRSNVDCTNCGGQFIATLDLSLNGNHQITCPHCRHVHYRVVRDGVVTEDRWRSSMSTFVVSTSVTVMVTTGTTMSNLSTSWLSRSDLNLVTTS